MFMAERDPDACSTRRPSSSPRYKWRHSGWKTLNHDVGQVSNYTDLQIKTNPPTNLFFWCSQNTRRLNQHGNHCQVAHTVHCTFAWCSWEEPQALRLEFVNQQTRNHSEASSVFGIIPTTGGTMPKIFSSRQFVRVSLHPQGQNYGFAAVSTLGFFCVSLVA